MLSRIDNLHNLWMRGELPAIDALVTLMSFYEKGKINDHLFDIVGQIILSLSQEELDRRLGIVPEQDEGAKDVTDNKAVQARQAVGIRRSG